jgi:Protein of unknown function (DUF4127)
LRIALLPIDERPVNTALAVDVAAIAGAQVEIPPMGLLPKMRVPGKVDLLGSWLLETAAQPTTDAVVVSIDMLVHGGLIAGRTTPDLTSPTLDRLGVLREVRADRPNLHISAVSLVTRASDSYSPDEEPSYWQQYGRELHRYGAALHRCFEDANREDRLDSSQEEIDQLDGAIPAAVRADFQARRLRNHIVNLECLRLLADGVINPLLITADDTARHSAGSLEQTWLRHWSRALQSGASLLMYPGADEVDAVLTARAITDRHQESVSFAVDCYTPDGLDRIANYENQPVRVGTSRQIAAAGAHLAVDGKPDIRLIVHPPDPGGGDRFGGRPVDDPAAVGGTLTLVKRSLDSGAQVALADVRYSNGSDPSLVQALQDAGLFPYLTAYAGWNTAGNSIGTTVAAAVCAVIGQRTGTYDRVAARRLLLHRVLEDHYYQSIIRTRLAASNDTYHPGPLTPEVQSAYLAEVTNALNLALRTLAQDEELEVRDVALPWGRTFEIDFRLDCAVPGDADSTC